MTFSTLTININLCSSQKRKYDSFKILKEEYKPEDGKFQHRYSSSHCWYFQC